MIPFWKVLIVVIVVFLLWSSLCESKEPYDVISPSPNGEQTTFSPTEQPTTTAASTTTSLMPTSDSSSSILLPSKAEIASLLPKVGENATSTQENIKNANFLISGFSNGINTVGSALKNPNLQLRSDPIVKKIPNVSVFNNSSFEADYYRKRFEIGS